MAETELILLTVVVEEAEEEEEPLLLVPELLATAVESHTSASRPANPPSVSLGVLEVEVVRWKSMEAMDGSKTYLV